MSLRTTVLQNLQRQNYLRLVCGPWDMSRSYEKQVMFHVLRCPQQSWSWPSENTDSHCAFLQLCAFSGFFTNSNQTPVVFVMLHTGLEKGSSWFECSFLSQEPAFCQPDRVQRSLHYVALVPMCTRYLWNPLFSDFTSGDRTSCTVSFQPLSNHHASTRCS